MLLVPLPRSLIISTNIRKVTNKMVTAITSSNRWKTTLRSRKPWAMSLEQHGWFKKKGWEHNIDHHCPRIISSTPPQPHRALDECGCGFPLHVQGRKNPRWRAWWETQYTDRHVSCHMYLNRHAGLKRVDTYLMPSALPPLYRNTAHLISLPNYFFLSPWKRKRCFAWVIDWEFERDIRKLQEWLQWEETWQLLYSSSTWYCIFLWWVLVVGASTGWSMARPTTLVSSSQILPLNSPTSIFFFPLCLWAKERGASKV